MLHKVRCSNGIDPPDVFYLNTEEEADNLFAIAVASKMYTYVSAEKVKNNYEVYDEWAEAEVLE